MFWKSGKSWTTAFKHLLVCACLFVQQTVLAKDQTEQNGDVIQWAILAAGLGSAVLYEEGHEGTLQFLESFAASQIVTAGLKSITDKERPNGNCCKSFPSGHTSKAFMGAAFIHERYGWKYAVPAYVAATYVGYSRVNADKHYVEDVVAGAAIGILSSFVFTSSYKSLEVTPVVGNGYYGVYLSSNW
ncbi:MAG: phosphatase PAP2 family protein [Xanthomonadales bacterium]|nr:phosphatase PAP2 family protein [Xanthomonadales bacterium]